MRRSGLGAGFLGTLLVGAIFSGAALAQSIGARSSAFAYDGASGLLTQEVIEPGTPALQLQTDYVYDTFGNKTAVTVSGADIAARSANTTYDAQGRFALSATNALGQSESWQYDGRFGLPTSHTGPNGLTTSWSYDGFGRKTQEIRPDGTQSRFAYQFCSGFNGGTASCPAGAVYLSQASSFAADGVTQNAPVAKVYFDGLDREVARDTQGFDGGIVRALQQYDSQGRLLKLSRPYFVNGGAPQWTTYTYDTLGRVTSALLPDGSSVQNAYHGLTTSETNALGQSRTVTKNSMGDIVSVTDALGHTMLYAYDPFGKLIQTKDAVGNIVSAAYDVRGRKIASSDPDLGAWSYTYNVLGELTSQTDARGQVTTQSYDLLGRRVQRVEPDMTCIWVYDAAANGIGKLASASITAGPGAGYQRDFAYDSLGRPVAVATMIDGTAYTMAAAYDANSRLSQVTYPSGFAASYHYNSLGYANQLTDGSTAQAYWTANALDAEQHLTQQTSGNGIVTTRGFDAATGRLLSVNAGPGNAVQSLSYTYDRLGNPLSRADNAVNLSESFTYDPLNRLLSATVSTNIAPVKSFSYDAIGNLLSKSDVGTYTYAPPGSPHPHAVLAVNGNTLSSTFTYDPDGNQTSGLGRTITWTSYNKPATITQGAHSASFLHDFDHQRFKQVSSDGTTLYIAAFGVVAELVAPGTQGARWNDYLSVGNVRVGVRFTDVGPQTVSTRYFHTDHLGSVAVITDEQGVVVERLSYDAWGKRRFANGADDPAGSIESLTSRGFTGHEELDSVALVHMNGRVYDPLVGRMISADPTVPDALNAQAWNRYSYVGNDPLAFTDPSGYSWLSSFFHSIGNAIRAVFQQVPILRAVVQLVVTVLATPFVGPIVAAAAGAALVNGLSGGNLGTMLRSAAIAGVTALAFDAVGTLTLGSAHASPSIGSDAYFANVAGHAGVGCLTSVASGGSCQSGALSAAAGAAATPLVPGDLIGGTAVSGVVGGLASVAGGGKFENGAVTGAFGYLFNACGGLNGCSLLGGAIGTGLGAAASTGCDVGTAGACAVANSAMVAASGAAGTAIGTAADALLDNTHGNSLDSQRQTFVYQLVNPAGDVLKYGITSEIVPQKRYSANEYAAMNAQMQVLGSYPRRFMARVE